MALGSEQLGVLARVLAAEHLHLEHHTVSPGVAKLSNNFMGELLRVRATGRAPGSSQLQHRQFIFKGLPADRQWSAGFGVTKFARNEIMFYTQILPAMERFRLKYGAEVSPYPVPELYEAQCDAQCTVLVLEDLSLTGFGATDRTQGLDLDSCSLVLREMATFHATSLAMQALEPAEFSRLREGMSEMLFTESMRPIFATVHVSCDPPSRLLRRRFPTSDYASQLEDKLTSHMFDNMMRLVNTETPLMVVNHGDCYINNIFFKRDELRWFDFQYVRYGSLALDLSFFLYTGTTQALRDQHWDRLMEVYRGALNHTLAKFGVARRVSREQLEAEMGQCAAFGTGMALFTLPLILGERPGVEQSPDVYEKMYRESENPRTAQRLTDMIVDALNRDFLNYKLAD